MKFHQVLAEWSMWFWPVFANHLWQATLVALPAGMAIRLLERAGARGRHLIGLVALIKFLVPSLWVMTALQACGVKLPGAATGGAALMLRIADPLVRVSGNQRIGLHSEVFCALSICWLTGVLLFLIRWHARRRKLMRVLSNRNAVVGGREIESFDRLRTRLNLSRRVGLSATSEIGSPVVWGVWHPIVVLPAGLAETLDRDELEVVMMHELIHIKHRDNLLGNLQMLVCCVFWFHPLVWWLDRKLADERELICDEQVVAVGHAPETYAAALWKVVRFGLGWPVAGASRAAGSNLKRRINLMLNFQSQLTTATNRAVAGLAVSVLIAFALALAAFSRGEVHAQEAQNEKQQDEQVQPMDRTTRPTILYQEKAEYTKEARDNEVEGTVLLNVVFGADARLHNIRVVRGLPDGLTEKAIEAAEKIRFKPAEKDGKPVSVRGTLEYSFRLK
jgi:TonB family protein